MSNFGDYEPEDAWDAGDDTRDLIANLIKRMDLLDGGGDHETIIVRLRELEVRLDRWREARQLPVEREALRASQIAEDIAFLRAREGI